MQGRAFLDIARDLAAGGTEAHRRATVVQAYYALFLEGREALMRWGIVTPPRPNVHSAVRLRFLYAADADLKSVGRALDKWCRLRNNASYNLAALPEFAADRIAQLSIVESADSLILLDAIDVDPVRRAAAVASFGP